MQAQQTRKVKRIPSSIVTLKNSETEKAKKLGLLHSKYISSLNIVDLFSEDFFRTTYKSLAAKPLKKFTYSSIQTRKEELLLLSDMFRKLGSKKLEKMSFLFQQSGRFRDGDLKFITKSVRCLTKLNSLEFQIFNFFYVTGTFFAPLKQSLRLLPSLQHLKIKTALCSDFTENGFNSLLESINGLNHQKVQSLCFDLSRMGKNLSGFLPKLMHKIEEFPQLRKLGLYLIDDRVSSKAFQESMDVIPKLKNLEEIRFSAADSNHQPLMQSLGTNPNIKSVQIRLSNLQKAGFEMLNKSLGSLNALERLKLNIEIPSQFMMVNKADPNFLDDECLTNLGSSLRKHLKTLKKFNLELRSPGTHICANITSRGCGDLAEALTECSNIDDLCLKYYNSLEFKDIDATFRAVQNMKQLKFLDLELKASEPVDSRAMLPLRDGLAFIKDVEKLYLNFKDFQGVTDQDMKDFAQAISHLNNMVDFCFELENIPKITQVGLNLIVETLKNLKALKTAQLNFVVGMSTGFFSRPIILEMPDINYQNKQIRFGQKRES